jgi:hypothetical protein
MGRRSHPRFYVAKPWDGAIRVLRDVVVSRIAADEFMAVSHAPAIVGEEMSLELITAGANHELRVQRAERPAPLPAAETEQREAETA